jgi:LysR family transcriptional regulator, nitrogen assimilation regulatory protein
MISYDPPPTKSLRVVPVMIEQLFLVSPHRARLSMSEPISFARLAGQQLVLPSARHGLRAIIDNCATAAGIVFSHAVEADSFAAMIALTAANLGSTILPLAPIHEKVKNELLSAAPLIDPTPERTLVIGYSADRAVSPAARYVGTVFGEIAGRLVRSGVWGGRMFDLANER